MKTQRRHELQTNWLADRVGEVLLVVKPYLKAVVGLLLAGLVLWAAVLFMAHRTANEQREHWNMLWGVLQGGPKAGETLESLADANVKQPTTDWAQLLLADNELSGGVTEWFTEKAAGRNMLNSALTMYENVFKNSTDPLAREHALYGIGQTEEALCKVGDARKAYEQLLTDYPNSSYFARAKQRIESLDRESTKDFYDWVAKLEPPPNVFGKGSEKSGDNSLSFPPELEPLSEFGKGKTPPPEPKPDTGPAIPKESPKASPKEPLKESKPGAAKTGAAKTGETKPGGATAPAGKTPEKSKPSETKTTTPPPASTPPAPPATAPKPADKTTPPAPGDNKKS